MNTKPKHGGARPGAGRKPIGGEPLTDEIRARCTAQERQQFKALGGSKWLRQMLRNSFHDEDER